MSKGFRVFAVLALVGLVAAGCQESPKPEMGESKPAGGLNTGAEGGSGKVQSDLTDSSQGNGGRAGDEKGENERSEAGAEASGSTGLNSPSADLASPPDSDNAADTQKPDGGVSMPAEEIALESKLPEIDPKWIRLDPEDEIWMDPVGKRIIVGGRICLTDGPLEMFACPQRSKEHESIVAVYTKSRLVHAGLLAIDLEPGHPVIWGEESYTPPEGPEVAISVSWMEGDKTVTRRAQELILNSRTKEIMQEAWVFAGSRFVTNEETGENIYLGDSGDLVCVSNFSSATLDVPIRSAVDNANLTYLANPQTIPPLDTRVLLFFEAAKKSEESSKSP